MKKAIMDYYHEGHVKSDPELYKEILHDEWKFFFFDNKDKLFMVLATNRFVLFCST